MHTVFAIVAIVGLMRLVDQPTSSAGESAVTSRDAAIVASSPDSRHKIAGAIAGDQSTVRNRRVLFITAQDSARCDMELARLRRPAGDFERMQARGWKIGAGDGSHLQIIDQDTVPDLVRRLNVRDFPTVACISDGEIVRSFQTGCTTPLDMWTFGWLLTGVDNRPAASVPEAARAESTGHYPLRGNHWSVDGDWQPARETVVSHLRGPNHAMHLDRSWSIESWSYEELRSLHDNLHEQFGGGVSAGRSKSASRNTNQFSANRKILGR